MQDPTFLVAAAATVLLAAGGVDNDYPGRYAFSLLLRAMAPDEVLLASYLEHG